MRRDKLCYDTAYLFGLMQEEEISSFFVNDDIIEIINDHTLTRMNDVGDKIYGKIIHLWEDEQKDYMLTDLVEIHFIELPKFRTLQEKNFKENLLQRWLAFLEKDINPNMLKELMSMEPAIKMAEDKLDYLSSDPHTIELYKARGDSEHEKANFYSSGQDNKAREIAKNMLKAGMEIELIMQMTGLKREEIEKIQ